MIVEVHHRCAEAVSYRAARVKSLFNVESGAEFSMRAELPIEDREWQIGVIVGPSGSGKTSLGRALADHSPGVGKMIDHHADWPDAPIIEAIAPEAPFDAVPAAL